MTDTLVTPALLDAITALAVRAGEAIEQARAAGVEVVTKADASPVSTADHAADAVITAGLRQLAPDTSIVSEEQPWPGPGARAGWRRFWLVDPLDGTREFLAGRPEYTVNVALIEDGVPVLGVVHVPRSGVTYAAAAGLGAWRHGRGEARTRLIATPPPPGAGLRIAESRSHGSPDLDAVLRAYDVRARLPIGSSLKFGLLAEGRADAYVRLGPTMEWDVAAGDAVFRHATPDGARPHASPLTYDRPDLRQPAFAVGFLPLAPAVIWLTGLPAAGKSTIAEALVARLRARGTAVEPLDGDAIRAVFPATGFSRPERDAHVRRVGYMASRLEAHGVTVVASLVSPYRDARDFVRGLCRQFVEVHVATPLAECERRDPKGLYARGRAGTATQVTGLDDPYEPPARPELTVDTTRFAADAAASRILGWLAQPPAAR